MALGKLGVLAWLAKAVGRLCRRPRSGLTPVVTVVPESADLAPDVRSHFGGLVGIGVVDDVSRIIARSDGGTADGAASCRLTRGSVVRASSGVSPN